MQVYPNPVQDMVKIQLNGIVNPSAGILISDATGKIMAKFRLNNNTATIDTRSWAAGIYLAHYNDGKNKYAVRIVKQ
jgi:hypothetical protein